MQSTVDVCEACPTCRSRAFEVWRSRYIGSGELTTGYLVRVWSCALCKREWEDAALAQINSAQENNARRAYWEAAEGRSPGHRGIGRADGAGHAVSAGSGLVLPIRELGRTG